MRVLLLHPEDRLSPFARAWRWDLVVDLGRAPANAYQDWCRQARCEVVSLYEYAEEIEDLYRVRELFEMGLGCTVDGTGIDWWDVLSLEIMSDVLQLLRVHRLAKSLDFADCDVCASRPDPAADALASMVGRPVHILGTTIQGGLRRLRGRAEFVAQLGPRQLAQVLEDKLDPTHAIRRRFSSLLAADNHAAVLLPTAYINGSRMAVAYASLLPEVKFKLIYTRSSGKLNSLPTNVTMASLSPYFARRNRSELEALRSAWSGLRKNLTESSEIWQTADAIGLLSRVSRLLPWAISLRDAWNRVFDCHEIRACLSTDDSNPPTRLPLMLAKWRGIPAISCHHGALDSAKVIKQHHESYYLAKSEMERDYLHRVCRVPGEKLVTGGPFAKRRSSGADEIGADRERWLVFFTEPYSSWGWRTEEVWGELLPRLASLARRLGLHLVLKLHPFENAKSYRRLLRQYVPQTRASILEGPFPSHLWHNVSVALTVQSSIALECAAQAIPVFLCAWLADSYNGYLRQFSRFQAGQVLHSIGDLGRVPELLQNGKVQPSPQTLVASLSADTFRTLLQGNPDRNLASEVQFAQTEGVVA